MTCCKDRFPLSQAGHLEMPSFLDEFLDDVVEFATFPNTKGQRWRVSHTTEFYSCHVAHWSGGIWRGGCRGDRGPTKIWRLVVFCVGSQVFFFWNLPDSSSTEVRQQKSNRRAARANGVFFWWVVEFFQHLLAGMAEWKNRSVIETQLHFPFRRSK